MRRKLPVQLIGLILLLSAVSAFLLLPEAAGQQQGQVLGGNITATEAVKQPQPVITQTAEPSVSVTSTPAATAAAKPAQALPPLHKTVATAPVVKSDESATQYTHTFAELAPQRETIYELPVTNGFSALGFVWNKGEFTYSWDGENFIEPEHLHDTPDGYNREAAELEFVTATHEKLYIKTAYVSDLTVSLIKPEQENPEFELSASGASYRGVLFTKLPIVSRQQWGADESKALWLPSYAPIVRIVTHHTAGSNVETNWPAVVRSIFSYHAVTLDWGDIGYNYLIDPNGVIYEGRQGGDGATAAHAQGYNTGSIGIAFMGNFSNGIPSPQAREAYTKLVAEKAALHNITLNWGTTIYGHRDFNQTSCPGNALYNELPTMISVIPAYINDNMQDIFAAQAITDQAFIDWQPRDPGESYGDLLLTFNYDFDVARSQIEAQIPPYSSIEYVNIFGNQAHLRLRRYYDSGDNLRLFRTKLLHTIFSLNPAVSEIEIVGDYVLFADH